MVRLAASAYVLLAVLSLCLAAAWQSLRMPSVTPQGLVMAFYQHGIGHLDGRSCPSYPVCSAYARDAIVVHGWWLGAWLAMDRLIHEADDVHAQYTVMVGAEKRFYDPLWRNDFWLNEMEKEEEKK